MNVYQFYLNHHSFVVLYFNSLKKMSILIRTFFLYTNMKFYPYLSNKNDRRRFSLSINHLNSNFIGLRSYLLIKNKDLKSYLTLKYNTGIILLSCVCLFTSFFSFFFFLGYPHVNSVTSNNVGVVMLFMSTYFWCCSFQNRKVLRFSSLPYLQPYR